MTTSEPSSPADASALLSATTPVTFRRWQDIIQTMYSQKDETRGVDGTFMWFMEEVGELAAALREGSPDELAAEFADVLAWLATLANISGVDLNRAVVRKYGSGCPGCGKVVCTCAIAEKP